MGIARIAFTFRQIAVDGPRATIQQREKILPVLCLGLCLAILGAGGCGQTAKQVTPSSAGQVNSYFGSPFENRLTTSSSVFDHSAKRINVSSSFFNGITFVPTTVISGTYVPAATGFLSVTEIFANSTGNPTPQNPPVTGAWAVEIPGAGALANLLNLSVSGTTLSVSAAPTAMAENTVCPNFAVKTPYLYVTVPNVNSTHDNADYGIVNISTQGSAVTFAAQPFLVGPVQQPAFTSTGGCSITNFGALTAYPLNSFGTASKVDLIGMGSAGLLASSFSSGGSGGLGAFGGGTGVLGVVESSTPVDINAVIAAKYNGFIYAPLNRVHQNYDITVLAAAFGDATATSQSCVALQSSLVANNGQGAGTVSVLPSVNTIYGGEFLTGTGAAAVNDPTAASGSENCDVAIDLGTEDFANTGSFPKATVFIGSNYPPYSATNPWICSDTGKTCAVSFPAAAIVGQVQGQYVLFVSASATSIPAAELPDSAGNRLAQPVGIYLFQKAQ